MLATDVEGIFRLAGSEKRIKELKTAFDTPPRYGKGLDWTGYTVHDAANILRRYFNNLPEPIIPLGNYAPFRQPLRGHQAEAVGHIEGQSPSTGGFDPNAVVRVYQHLIKGLPSLNRQLLLYILDLLAVFAAKADVNKMTTHNLAAIFQPGILSHPEHDMSPQDYRLSQDVLIFLIDNQDHFLIGMEGTAVDEGTVKHVESGPSTPQAKSPTAPGRNNSGIGRSASTSSSAGADSLRKYGGVRRNVSTSSKRSRHSGAIPSPLTPAFATPTTSSAVHRSNTLPSQRSPALGSPRFPKDRSGQSTPGVEEPRTPITSPIAAEAAAIVANLGQSSKKPSGTLEDAQGLAPTTRGDPPKTEPSDLGPEKTMPIRAQTMPPDRIDLPQPVPMPVVQQGQPAAVTPGAGQIPGAFPLPSPGVIPPSEDVTPNATEPQASELLPLSAPAPAINQRSPRLTPTRERSEFIEAPIDPEPLGDSSPATRTFTQILSKATASPSNDGREARKPNKLQKKRVPSSAISSAHSSTHSLTGIDAGVGMSQLPPAQNSPLHPPQPLFAQGYAQAGGSREALQSQNNDSGSSRHSGTTLKPNMSPSTSFRSHSTATEYSEVDHNDEPKEEKRSFWKAHKRGESRATPIASQTDLHGSVPGGDKSMSSFGSGSGWGGSRRSLQYDSHQTPDLSTAYGSPPDSDKPEKKGAFDWFHKKRQDQKGRPDKRDRAKSPPGSSNYLPTPQGLKPQENDGGRGRSMDIPRSTAEASNESTPTGSASQVPTVPASSNITTASSASPTAPPANLDQPSQPSNKTHYPTSAVPTTESNQQANAAPFDQRSAHAPIPFHPVPSEFTSQPQAEAPTRQNLPSAQTEDEPYHSASRPTTPVQVAQASSSSTTPQAAPSANVQYHGLSSPTS
jgi:hypothetical protein